MDNNMPGNCVATDIEESFIGFSIGPNPTSGRLNIRSVENLDVELWNVQGQLVRTFASVPPNSQLELGDLADGVYTIVVDNGMTRKENRLIIQH